MWDRDDQNEVPPIRDLTWVIPYYINPTMLKLHIQNWLRFPEEIARRLSIIVIDDGSPHAPAVKTLRVHRDALRQRLRSLQLFRATRDIPWNQHGCRNLGARKADTKWLLVSDIDKLALWPSIARVMSADLDERQLYGLRNIKMHNRLLSVDKPLRSNSILVTKDLYWEVGGYDEDFCNSYGGDTEFLNAVESVTGRRQVFLQGASLIRYDGSTGVDATTSTLDRDWYAEKYRKIRDAKKHSGNTIPERPIRFPWIEQEL